ncbi:hypothetical protein X961_5815 [Burkholderia pseudomallei MSHR5613]|nr:hypothetical protein X961_5815 [Burkholderia pseudomallei MSHR5613]
MSATHRQNAANEKRPNTMPRSRGTTKSGPCARCDETASTLPSSGKTARRPLQAGPSAPASDVTANASAAPAASRPARSACDNGARGASVAPRGRQDCPKHVAANATAVAAGGVAGSRASALAAAAQAARPAASASGHRCRRQVHAYAKLNASDAAIAESDSNAACAPNAGPRSTATRKRIGPATTGSPASQPAIDGPHLLPAIDTSSRNSGTSVSFSASIAGASGKRGMLSERRAMPRERADRPPPRARHRRQARARPPRIARTADAAFVSHLRKNRRPPPC